MPTRRLLTPGEEVEAISNRSTSWLLSAIDDLIAARVRKDGEAYRRAYETTAEGFTRVSEAADMSGRRRMSLLAERAAGGLSDAERAASAAEEPGGIAPGEPIAPVSFREVVADIVSRRPELAEGYRAVQEVYRRHGFACARSTDLAVTERVQSVLANVVLDGGIASPRKVIEALGDWKRSYADTVYETNVKTAYTAGMWKRIEEPEVARVLPGMRFVSSLLPTTRPNHAAAHGLTAPSSSHLWEVFSPPLGYRCCCSVREISVIEARREGLVDADGRLRTIVPPTFSAARPDPGFGRGRPDRAIRQGAL